MTLDEIRKMPGRGLDKAIQRALFGPFPLGTIPASPAKLYHKDLNACREAEGRLAEMGLKTEFVQALIRIIPFPAIAPHDLDESMRGVAEAWFDRIHATARQRAEAILAAVQTKEAVDANQNPA